VRATPGRDLAQARKGEGAERKELKGRNEEQQKDNQSRKGYLL
jgi:hypothetical protein